MTFQLILAGPNQPGVALSRKITKELQTYKKNAIRFIYNCYVTSQPGAILNVDLDMNHEHACAVALNALYKKALQNLASVVLCSDQRFMHWFYCMKKYSDLEVFKLTENNAERLLLRNEAIVLLVTEKEHKILRNYVKSFNFFCLIVDEADVMCEKMITKQIQADFHLGITHRNFITEPNQQLQWQLTNWVLKKSNKRFFKKTDFIDYDNAYLDIHVDPYAWFRLILTWDLCSDGDRLRHEEEKVQLHENINQCAELHGSNSSPGGGGGKTKRKPASKQNFTAQKTRLRRRIVEEESFEHWTSDEDKPPDLSVFEVSISSSVSSSASNSPRKLRLKSPRGKEKPIDEFRSSYVEIKRRKLDFGASLPQNDQSLRKTQSSGVLLVDKDVVDEFSKPFEGRRLQTTNSDSALLSTSRNVQEELNDIQIQREFSENFDVPTSTKQLISEKHLETLVTSEIACPTCSSSKIHSQEDVLESLNLYLSQNEAEKQETPKELTTNTTPTWNDSSDDDIDNYMLQFLENMKRENKLNPKSTESLKLSTTSKMMPSCSKKETDACQKYPSDDSDSDNFLKEIMADKTCKKSVANVINSHLLDSPEEDNFLVSFL